MKGFCEGCVFKTGNFVKGPVLSWKSLWRILFQDEKVYEVSEKHVGNKSDIKNP